MSNDRLALDSVVVRNPDQLSGDIGDEVVLLSVEQGAYYQLNQVGSRIWALVESPITIGALVERLSNEFNVTRHDCEAEVFAFLRTLKSERLITIRSGEPAP